MCAQLCPTLCNPMDCSPPGSCVHGIFQARLLEQVSMFISGDLPNAGIEPASLGSPELAGGFFTTAPPRKSLMYIYIYSVYIYTYTHMFLIYQQISFKFSCIFKHYKTKSWFINCVPLMIWNQDDMIKWKVFFNLSHFILIWITWLTYLVILTTCGRRLFRGQA